MIVYNKGVDTEIILSEDIEKFYLLDPSVMGKTYSYRMNKLDHAAFKVSIVGFGAVLNVTNVVYTENSSSRLMFWQNRSMTFKTDCLKGKRVLFSLDDRNDIVIEIQEK